MKRTHKKVLFTVGGVFTVCLVTTIVLVVSKNSEEAQAVCLSRDNSRIRRTDSRYYRGCYCEYRYHKSDLRFGYQRLGR